MAAGGAHPEPAPAEALARMETMGLIARVKDGDRRALELLFERHYPRVHRIVRVRLGRALESRAEVEDVVQRVMEQALTDLDSFQPCEDAHFVDWLSRIAEHELADLARHHRAQKRDLRREVSLDALLSSSSAPSAGFDPKDEGTGPLERISRKELETLLDQCLAELPEDAREVLLLRDYAGGSWAWVAETLGRGTAEAARKFHARSLAELGALVARRSGERAGGNRD